MTNKIYPDSTSANYVYDLVGKIRQVTDPTGSYGFAYDNMGRLIGTTTQYSFLPGSTFTNSYAYDAASNRTSFGAPDGSTLTYNYDTLNRLNTLNSSSAGQFTFGYDALSRRTSLARPNGVNTTYNYDSLSRLLSVLHQAGGTTTDGATYTLDLAGNRTAKQNLLNGITENYTYDLIYQLAQATQNGNTTEGYSYDAVGNRLSSLTVPSLTYNGSNELISTSRSSYAYDYNGNLISKTNSSGTTSYAWDYENRLASVTLPGSGGTVTFKYDPFGRRIQKSGPAGTTNFLYDGANIVADLDVSGTVLARYTQGSGIDEPLASVTGLGAAFFEADGLGSVTSLSGASGVTDTYTYKPFGITTANGTNPNRFRFTGREWDQETGLYYYRARYYDPATGRFLSEDLLRFEAGADFYPYVGNSPSNFVDPLGLCPPTDPCKVPLYPPGENPDRNIYWTVQGGPLFWAYEQDWTGAPWDYKRQGDQYDDAGNFNFGATGAALGIPDSALLYGADVFKRFRNLKKHQPPNGNEAQKNEMIQRGIDYFKNGCGPPIEFPDPPMLP